MKSILKKALYNGLSYLEYRALIAKYSIESKTTGNNPTESHVAFTKLNEVRMRRLDKTLKVTEETQSFLENLKSDYIWLVITESWCGDAAQILPVINKMAQVSKQIDLHIVLRDENEDLMNLFLTNGTKSIPKLIILDKETLAVIADFGPRPNTAKQLILDYKATHEIVDEAAKIELQKWYLQDKGVEVQKEIEELMK